MFIYSFVVEIDEGSVERGLITAENFFNALEKLTDYYGETIADIHMRVISDGEIIFISDEFKGIVEDIEKKAIW